MNLLDRIFRRQNRIENFLEKKLDDAYEETELQLYVNAFALHVIVNLIANIVSNIEFKTYGKGAVEIKEEMWIKLNLHPNINQNSTEFLRELTRKYLFGEVLIVEVNDQYIIADDYKITERAIVGDIFENVTKGDYKFMDKFKAEDVVFLRYSNRKTNCVIDNVLDFYRKLIEIAARKYERSGEEKGILNISQKERGDPDFKKVYEKITNSDFKDFFSKGNKILPLFDGYTYQSMTSESTKKYSNEISDIKTLFEEALIRTAQAFNVPPGLVRGDVAGVKDAYNMLLTNCIDPIAHAVSEELTYKMFTKEQIMQGYAVEADTTCIKHIDIFDLASSIDKLIGSGFLSIDEVRTKSGLRELNTEWSKAHYMTLNNSTAESVLNAGADGADGNEGGEKNDDV